MTNHTEKKIQLPYPAVKLIIHRSPMLLIDSLIEREGDNAAARAKIIPETLCCDKNRGILPEYFIEIMAQTMAAANGYDFLIKNRSPLDGFIVGLDNFSLKHSIPAKETDFVIRIKKTLEFGSMKVMQGEVFTGDISVATGELKVWEQDNNEE